MEWAKAPDVKKDVEKILSILDFPHINIDRLFIYRTSGSKSRAYARTWGFPKIFQDALHIEPAYVIEVISSSYDTLNADEKKRVLIHELLHIPKNFSGALLPHHTKHRSLHKVATQLYKMYKAHSQKKIVS